MVRIQPDGPRFEFSINVRIQSFGVYASTREDIDLTDWSSQQKDEFLRMQFRAQHAYYQEHFPEADYLIIRSCDQPIGRLYVDRNAEEMHILDIALLPDQRGGGIGGQIMQDLLSEAGAAGKPVRIYVLRENVALHLYERLGFRQTEDAGVYLLMEWVPDGVCAAK